MYQFLVLIKLVQLKAMANGAWGQSPPAAGGHRGLGPGEFCHFF